MDKVIKVKFDCISGKSARYTIGKPGGLVSGAIYITPPAEVPDRIILVLKEDEDGKKES